MRRVSKSTITRLSAYLRALEELAARGEHTISSRDLAERAGTTSAQVRKDLSYFGSFGKRGLGYAVPGLLDSLRSILGLDRGWGVGVIGAGRIGQALANYPNFARKGFEVRAVFDSDPAKIGQQLDGLVILDIEEMTTVIERLGIEIVIIATDAGAAQEVTDRAVAAGVRAVLNFAPVHLEVPPGVVVNSVNMVPELERLSFALTMLSDSDSR